jgi:hypothetical protein
MDPGINKRKIVQFLQLKRQKKISTKTIYLALSLHEGPPKRTFSTSKHEISSLSYIFGGNFCLPGSGSSRLKSVRIRVHDTDL